MKRSIDSHIQCFSKRQTSFTGSCSNLREHCDYSFGHGEIDLCLRAPSCYVASLECVGSKAHGTSRMRTALFWVTTRPTLLIFLDH